MYKAMWFLRFRINGGAWLFLRTGGYDAGTEQ